MEYIDQYMLNDIYKTLYKSNFKKVMDEINNYKFNSLREHLSLFICEKNRLNSLFPRNKYERYKKYIYRIENDLNSYIDKQLKKCIDFNVLYLTIYKNDNIVPNEITFDNIPITHLKKLNFHILNNSDNDISVIGIYIYHIK